MNNNTIPADMPIDSGTRDPKIGGVATNTDVEKAERVKGSDVMKYKYKEENAYHYGCDCYVGSPQ